MVELCYYSLSTWSCKGPVALASLVAGYRDSEHSQAEARQHISVTVQGATGRVAGLPASLHGHLEQTQLDFVTVGCCPIQ